MTGRVRSRDRRVAVSGYYRYISGGVWRRYDRSVLNGTRAQTTDVVGHREQDNAFYSLHKHELFSRLNGQEHTGGELTKEYVNWPLGPYYVATPDIFGYPNWTAVGQAAAEKTNPSTPHVCLPAFLGELKDFPGMVKEIPLLLRGKWAKFLKSHKLSKRQKAVKLADTALMGIGKGNLAWRFGWAPFIGDMLKLIGAMDAILKRLEVLKKLRAGRVLRRRHRLPSQSAAYDDGLITTNSSPTVRHRKTRCYQANSWISCNWKLKATSTLPEADADLFWLALRSTYGLNTYGAFLAAWELIPWSWLVDWFGNIGNWLGANNNSLPVEIVSMCWMRTSRLITTFSPVTVPSGYSLSGLFSQWAVSKERVVLNPTLITMLPSLPTIPALSAGQLSILGSLILTSRKGLARK